MNDREFLDEVEKDLDLFKQKENNERLVLLAGLYESCAFLKEKTDKEFNLRFIYGYTVSKYIIEQAKERLDKTK